MFLYLQTLLTTTKIYISFSLCLSKYRSDVSENLSYRHGRKHIHSSDCASYELRLYLLLFYTVDNDTNGEGKNRSYLDV